VTRVGGSLRPSLKPSGLQRLSRLCLGRMWSGHLLIASVLKMHCHNEVIGHAGIYLRDAEFDARPVKIGGVGDYAGRTNESAPKAGALPIFTRSEPQAATLPGMTSSSLLEFAIGIDRGFIASGISRTRSTCRSPFFRLAPLTLT
jgi:hypothetical protein